MSLSSFYYFLEANKINIAYKLFYNFNHFIMHFTNSLIQFLRVISHYYLGNNFHKFMMKAR